MLIKSLLGALVGGIVMKTLGIPAKFGTAGAIVPLIQAVFSPPKKRNRLKKRKLKR